MQRIFSISFLFLLIAFQGIAQKLEWQNPDVTSQNREPIRASAIPFLTEADARAGFDKASNIELLNGKWRFRMFANPLSLPAQFEKMRFEDDTWDNFQVPANWEFKNYATPIYASDARDLATWDSTTKIVEPQPPRIPAENPTGIYRRRFLLPEAWNGKEIFLHFGANKSAFYVYVNGRKVGYSEDSKLPAEFDITDFVRPKENTVCLVVLRYSDASFLECQDFWRVSGIERDVYAFAVPKNWIRDFTIKATLDEGFRKGNLVMDLKIKSHTSENTPGLVEATLKDEKGKVVWQEQKAVTPNPKQEISLPGFFRFSFSGVKPWSAEVPNLYQLEIKWKDAAGDLKQLIRQQVGFRNVDVKDGIFWVNGKAVKLNGVNQHEHDPDGAHAVSEALMLKDIMLMKQLNINAVRTAQYPHHPRWYELCNEYGLYVVDEANIKCPELKDPLPGRAEWRKAFTERMTRMVERDKNQPCVIGWGLGGDATNGANFQAGKELVTALDSRPIVSDQMLTRNFSAEWIDQGMRTYRNGNEVFWYGESPENEADTNAFRKGLVNPDRVVKPLAENQKRDFAPVGVEFQAEEKSVRLKISNRYSFRDLKHVTGKVLWYRNGIKVTEEKLNNKNLNPDMIQELTLKYPSKLEANQGLDGCELGIEFIHNQAEAAIPLNHEVASFRFPLKSQPK